jgi:hypothetical protein
LSLSLREGLDSPEVGNFLSDFGVRIWDLFRGEGEKGLKMLALVPFPRIPAAQ